VKSDFRLPKQDGSDTKSPLYEGQVRFFTIIPNPLTRLKQQSSIKLEMEGIVGFKQLAEATGICYQSLSNLYLRELCEIATQADPGLNAN